MAKSEFYYKPRTLPYFETTFRDQPEADKRESRSNLWESECVRKLWHWKTRHFIFTLKSSGLKPRDIRVIHRSPGVIRIIAAACPKKVPPTNGSGCCGHMKRKTEKQSIVEAKNASRCYCFLLFSPLVLHIYHRLKDWLWSALAAFNTASFKI
jgi:hypothetical protein